MHIILAAEIREGILHIGQDFPTLVTITNYNKKLYLQGHPHSCDINGVKQSIQSNIDNALAENINF